MELFSPITIRQMTLKNRVVMPPMNVAMGPRSSRARAYYAERARGGVGAITLQPVLVDVLSSDEAWGRAGAVNEFVAGLRPLCDAVHEAGAKVGIELAQSNRFPQGLSADDTRGEPIAPSPRVEGDPPAPFVAPGTKMRALTIPEIETIIHNFGVAAFNASRAGFDFVEVHGAHSMLPCQFFSPLENQRNDKYGGDLTRRMQFGIECVTTIRKAVGDNFPIFFRLGAFDGRPGGVVIEEGAEYAHQLEKAGADVIDVSLVSGSYIPIADHPFGCFAHLAEGVKKKVTIPVMAVGRIHKPEIAEAILTRGQADIIGIGRQLIADPYWVNKVKEGRVEDITPCLSCNTCLGTHLSRKLRCAVNFTAGQETEYRLTAAEKPKKVFVVGGGPAGMEAARVAAMRGHKVTLYEKKDKLGGQLLLASVAPYKDDIANFTRYLTSQLEKARVEVKLGVEATAELVEKRKADVVVIAIGASPIVPKDVPGVGRKNVIGALDVFAGVKKVGQRVVVIGGGMVGCEVAELLAQKGKKVTILEMLDEIGSDIGEAIRETVLSRLQNAGIEMFTKAKAEEITQRGVRATRKNSSQVFEADTVVLAVGFTPNTELTQKLKGKVAALYPIGDCVEPRKIVDAIDDGNRVGRGI